METKRTEVAERLLKNDFKERLITAVKRYKEKTNKN